MASFLETWWIFIISFCAFLGATHYLFHQQHYNWALLFAFIQLLFAFLVKKHYYLCFKRLVRLETFLFLVCSFVLLRFIYNSISI